jgi:superfamily I DNA and/or RNA helicase
MGQGSERDVVILSTVRSADASHMPCLDGGESLPPQQTRRFLGFLAQEQLVNVAITRAREALIVVGDSNTLGLHPMWAEWLADAQSHNSHSSSLVLRPSQAPWTEA